MSTTRFETTPLKIRDWTILMLPKSASAKLPSRGMTLVEGTINDFRSKIVLEPDAGVATGLGSTLACVNSLELKQAIR